MLKNLLRLTLICMICMSSFDLQAQISVGGSPMTFSHPEVFIGATIPTISLSAPSVGVLLAQDEDRDRNGYNHRDAVALVVNKGLEDGAWTNLPNGSRIWRMALKSSGAYSLEVNFHDLFIPEGGTLYIFNPSGTEIFGAYTSQNNKESGRMSLEMIQGEELRIEYTEPNAELGQGRIHIQDVAYRYRNVMADSQSCEVDVSCSESNGWEDQVKSVVRIRTRINGQFFWSTGTLMNNTAQDCRPFILTNMHSSIDEGTQSTFSDFEFYRFYFNFERISCGEGPISQVHTIAGCMKKADSNDNGGAMGSDFMLVEISSAIPTTYGVFFAGWNVSAATQAGGVSIHHPSAGPKKISVYQENVISSSWGVSDSHWSVKWASTINGHGVTEGGSSGAGLFDSAGLVIGTLTGGSAYCNEILPGGQNQPDYFGKMSWHWNNNPNPTSEKLKEWLDPLNSGAIMFNGNSDACNVLGLQELNALEISLFPNPSDGLVFISYASYISNLIIKVHDITGKLITAELYSVSIDDTNVILDFSNLQDGLYFILTSDQEGLQLTKRLILRH
jgi:hypothetical protein